MESSARMIPDRNDIPVEDRWDLTPLFRDDAEWETLFGEVESLLDRYEEHKGRLGESAESLCAAITFDLEVSRKIDRLYTYAHLKSDEDQGNQAFLALHERAVRLATRASEISSFIRPEIMEIPEERIRSFMDRECLLPYRFHLEKILRYRDHTRTSPEESLLAASREMAQTAGQIFRQLDNVDLQFGTTMDESGEVVELSHGNFITFLQHRDREIRKKVFFQYYDGYHRHRHTLSAALAGAVKADLFYARARRFPTCRAAALFSDPMPESVYDNLVRTVRGGLPVLFRYLSLRKRALKLPDLHFYDTYVPVAGTTDFRMHYEEAVEVCATALAPLGDAYTRQVKAGLLGGWVDRYENRGKRSGAYSSGCYDSPPYILLNYDPANIGSLYTLIHEAGHSMHSHLAKSRQPYVYHGYTIFVAEVASTFNEILLSRHLLDRFADDPGMTAYILNREIDNIRATLFRQTMFAEFEARIHDLVENSKPLTLEQITGIYRALLGDYFGGELVIDAPLCLECLRIPHFYSAFYVYKYATGISAAIALARRVMDGEPGATDDYLRFLGLGGSRYPLEQLMEAGVDMRDPGPVQAAIDHFDRRVHQLESALDALAG
ncbi:MAG: oligoendopeptidase F [Desulfobacterales bacterium]